MAALGLERQAHAERVEQLTRPRARRDHHRAREAVRDVGHDRVPGLALARNDLHGTFARDLSARLDQKIAQRAHEPLRIDGVAASGHQHAAPDPARNAGKHLAQIISGKLLAGDAVSLSDLALERSRPGFGLALPYLDLTDW